MTDNHDYNTPASGSADWDVPLNTNFQNLDTDVEIRDTDANKSNYTPKDGALYRATDTGGVYLGDGSSWNLVDIEVDVLSASGTIVDPAGVSHTGELADVSDLLNVEDDGTVVVSDATALNAGSNLTATDDGDQTVTLDATGGSSLDTSTAGYSLPLANSLRQNHNADRQPLAKYHNGVTYFTYGTTDGSAITVHAGSYDHTTEDVTTTTIATLSSNDDHYLPYMTVDNDGYIYVFHSFRDTNATVERSDNAEDISSFSTAATLTTRDYDYGQAVVDDNNQIHLFVRSDDGTGRPLYHLEASGGASGGESWTATKVVEFGNGNWIYPRANQYRYDGTDIHCLIAPRPDGTSNYEDPAYLTYRPSDGSVRGADGTTITLPATLTNLENTNSIVAATQTANPNALSLIDGTPHVGYFTGYDTAGTFDINHAYYSSGWNRTTLEADVSDVNRMGILIGGGEIRHYNSGGGGAPVAMYRSTDGGDTWTNRQLARSDPEQDNFGDLYEVKGGIAQFGLIGVREGGGVDTDTLWPLTPEFDIPHTRPDGLVSSAMSGSVTLSSGSATVDTGIPTSEVATFGLFLGPSTSDADVAGDIRADSGTGTYVIDIEETDTSVGNPTVAFDVLRVR